MRSHLRREARISARRLAAYAAACTSVMAAADQAQAVITYVPKSVALLDTTLGDGAESIDLTFGAEPHHLAIAHGLGDTDAATGYAFMDSSATGVPGIDGIAGIPAGGFYYAQKVAYNTPISGLAFLAPQVASTVAFNTGYANSQFKDPGIGFIGVKFNTNQYGWVRVDMGGVPLNNFTVVDYAFAGPGEAIRAGEGVPEPSSLAVLALGAIGLASWRKSRGKQLV
jgi:hypothetical protein